MRYEDFFIREFLPFIESHYRIRAGRRYRGITGISMGGYGALRFAFRYPQLFGSVSAHSAALVAKLPDVQAFEPRSRRRLRAMMGAAFGSPFDRAFWDRNNPFTLVENGARPGRHARSTLIAAPRINSASTPARRHFTTCSPPRKSRTNFISIPGGHDWTYFAEHFPASLEFHSRAFGLSLRCKVTNRSSAVCLQAISARRDARPRAPEFADTMVRTQSMREILSC